MVRRKEFSLKFTDSLLLAEPGLPDGTYTSSTIANDIFNDPEAWSDASLDSGESDHLEKEVFPQSAVPSSSKPHQEFLIRTLSKRSTSSRRRRASFSSVSSPESSSESPELKLDGKRLSIVFTNFGAFPYSPSTSSTPSTESTTGRLPLTVTTAVGNLALPSAGVGSPIVVSASATWSFLEWLGTGSQPATPKLPHTGGYVHKTHRIPPVPRLSGSNAASATSSPRKSTFLTVPNVPPTPTKFIQQRRRPLPSVPTPLPTAQPTQPSPLQITSPPPPPPRGGRARSPSPPVPVVTEPPPLPPPYGPPMTEPQTAQPQRSIRKLPPPQTATLVPREKAPIAWLAS